jgi:ribosome biogenesis protein BMS1
MSSTLGARAAGGDDLGPPPVIVAVVGPPGVGKSTLVRSLVRRFTKTTLSEIQGPVTLVSGVFFFLILIFGSSLTDSDTSSGKSRRLTIVECPNDLGAMVDIAKVADLVLLMVDGSFGFEMVCLFFLSHFSRGRH